MSSPAEEMTEPGPPGRARPSSLKQIPQILRPSHDTSSWWLLTTHESVTPLMPSAGEE